MKYALAIGYGCGCLVTALGLHIGLAPNPLAISIAAIVVTGMWLAIIRLMEC